MNSYSKVAAAFGMAAGMCLLSQTSARADDSCKGANGVPSIAIPDTTPTSCTTSPIRAEYRAEAPQGSVTLQCLWKAADPAPVVDGRFHMTYTTEKDTGIKRTLLRLSDTIVVIEDNPALPDVAVQFFTTSGMISARLCEVADFNTLTVSGCVLDETATPFKNIPAIDARVSHSCADYVAKMSADRRITNDRYLPTNARNRLSSVRQFINELAHQ